MVDRTTQHGEHGVSTRTAHWHCECASECACARVCVRIHASVTYEGPILAQDGECRVSRGADVGRHLDRADVEQRQLA